MRRPCANDTVESLRHSLRALGLATSGKKDTLLKRARKAYSSLEGECQLAGAASPATSPADGSAAAAGVNSLPARGYPGKFKAFLLFDAEGTCESGKDYDYPNEIIEFPVVLLKWRLQPRPGNPFCQELYIASSFQSYVRPTFQPELSDFCTSLTGISQATIDAAPEFPDVLADFERWLGTHGLDTKAKGEDKDWLWVTDGPWDLRDFVTKQLYISRLKPALYPYLSGPVLDLKTALHDRWRTELIRTTPEPTIEFPLTERAPTDPLSPPAGSDGSDNGLPDPKVPPTAPTSPAAPLSPSAKAAVPSLLPVNISLPSSYSPPTCPPPLRSSRSSAQSLPRRRSSSAEASPLSSPSTPRRSSRVDAAVLVEPAILPPAPTTPAATVPSPLMRALGAERPPQRPLSRVNRHLKDAFKKDNVHQGRYLNIEGMIRRLNMGSFEGPPHSGIVDAFNMARVVIRLSQLAPALRTQLLEPNMHVQQGTKVFAWMTRDGEIDLSAITRGSLADAKGIVKPAAASAVGPTKAKDTTEPTPSRQDDVPDETSTQLKAEEPSQGETAPVNETSAADEEAGEQAPESSDGERREGSAPGGFWSWLQGRSGG